MQKWEYLRLQYDFTNEKYLITQFKKDGREEVEHGGKDIWWRLFDQKIYELGSQGWELVGVSPYVYGPSYADTRSWHLWFKRPLAD